MNLAIYGSIPTPAPVSNTVQIPLLPTSGQPLTIDLKIQPAASRTIPLHVFTPWSDSERPASTAFVSVGDGLATDQTCVPAAGVPPCGGAAPVSQLSITDGAVAVVVPASSVTPTGTPTDTPTSTPQPSPTATAEHTATASLLTPTVVTPTPVPTCVGDCSGDSRVTIDEILTMVNIALGNALPATCVAGDANGDGQITVDEILAAVNNSLNGCSGALRADEGLSYRRERRKVDGLVRLLCTLRGGALPD
jgi:hypothetical protein